MKDFTKEISILFEKFQKGAPFAFSKFADGEWAAMLNETLNNSEFENTPHTDERYREELINAIQYKDVNLVLTAQHVAEGLAGDFYVISKDNEFF